MPFTLDPTALIGNALSSVIGAPIVIGLSSQNAPIPTFVIGTVKGEKFQSSSNIPTLQLQPGNLRTKSSINGGKYYFEIVLTQDPDLQTEWLTTVATVLQQFSSVGNALASFGSVIPNLGGVTASYAASQLSTLHDMKNNNQPLLMLNAYYSFGSISQKNPNLSSSWVIEDITGSKEEAEAGSIIGVSCTEVLTKRDASASLKNLLSNFGNEVLSGGAGSALGSLL